MNIAKSIHERLQMQDPPHPVQVYEFTRLCLSVKTVWGSACVATVLGILLSVFMRGYNCKILLNLRKSMNLLDYVCL